MSGMKLLCCLFCLVFYPVFSQYYGQPEQVHLSYGVTPQQMIVTWVTMSESNSSIVEYGQNGLDQVAYGTETKFVDSGEEKRVIFIHRVTLNDLIPGKMYKYHCGGRFGWSGIYTFTAMKDSTEWSPRLLVYGDFGNVNSQSMARIQQETQRGHFDAVLHVGDIAYNLDTSNGRIGDAFMRQIETVAAYVPYMTCPGNHEAAYNFSHYKYRFNMPGDEQKNMYYSFNMGPAHIISFSTEYYYEVSYGWSQIFTQYFWLEKDLQEANKPENRAKRPWIIVFGHRPMYCSNADDPTMCSNIDNYVRVGIPHVHAFSLEDLFYKYGVDLHFYGHEHSYERMWPVYNRKVCNGSNNEPYRNPPAPVHVVTGSAGCDEGEDPFISNGLPWSAFRSDDYGYTRMNIINSTHLYLEQVSDDKDGAVIDKMLLIKEKHGMGTFNCH